MGNRPTTAKRTEDAENDDVIAGVADMQGWRDEMEVRQQLLRETTPAAGSAVPTYFLPRMRTHCARHCPIKEVYHCLPYLMGMAVRRWLKLREYCELGQSPLALSAKRSALSRLTAWPGS